MLKFMITGLVNSGTSMLARLFYVAGFNIAAKKNASRVRRFRYWGWGHFECFSLRKLVKRYRGQEDDVNRAVPAFRRWLQKHPNVDGLKRPEMWWDIWKEIIPRDTVIFFMHRDRDDYITSCLSNRHRYDIADRNRMWDNYWQEVPVIQAKWPNTEIVEFRDLVNPEGHERVNQILTKHFPDAKFDFSCIEPKQEWQQ